MIKLTTGHGLMPFLPHLVLAHELIAGDPLAVHHVVDKTDKYSIVQKLYLVNVVFKRYYISKQRSCK